MFDEFFLLLATIYRRAHTHTHTFEAQRPSRHSKKKTQTSKMLLQTASIAATDNTSTSVALCRSVRVRLLVHTRCLPHVRASNKRQQQNNNSNRSTTCCSCISNLLASKCSDTLYLSPTNDKRN